MVAGRTAHLPTVGIPRFEANRRSGVLLGSATASVGGGLRARAPFACMLSLRAADFVAAVRRVPTKVSMSPGSRKALFCIRKRNIKGFKNKDLT